MARRFVLLSAFLAAASLVGNLGSSAQPIRGAALRPAIPQPAPPRPRPARPVTPVGTLVAYVRTGRTVAVRSRPGGPVLARLSSRTEFGSPRTFAFTAGGRVITSELPNARTGWLDARGGVRLTRVRIELEADLSARLLRVRGGGRLLRTLRIGIGAPGTATPTGRFAVTDKLRGAAYSTAYGCCILALSGHQTNLPRGWTGGDRLAIHGGSTAGAVSTGCLHADEADLRWLMRIVPLGAQITIHP